jgi:hypothetical protein
VKLNLTKIYQNVMNSMSDKQVYGLLASGVLNTDLVNEYIKNGKNAPYLLVEHLIVKLEI